MRKFVLALALVGVCATAASADLDLFYDVRGTIGDIDAPSEPFINSASLSIYVGSYVGQNYPLQNAGGRGDGERAYLSPKISDYSNPYSLIPGDTDGIDEHKWIDDVYDYSLASLNLYASFSGNAGEVISSIGVDQDVTADPANDPSDFEMPTITTEIVNTGLWDGHSPVGPTAGASVAMKMVQVPVVAGPAFDLVSDLLRSGDTELIATVNLEGQFRAGTTTVGLYNVYLSVNNLLVTRVKEGGTTDVNVNFGYDGSGSPEAGGVGTVENTTSATADAVITVVRKGDFDYDGAAATSVDDAAYYSINLNSTNTNANPVENYLGDFDGDGDPCTSVDDLGYFLANVVP